MDLRVSEAAERQEWILARSYGDLRVELNRNVEVDADLADRIAEVLKAGVGILTSIDHQDATTAATDHFIQAEVLKVAAVAQIHGVATIIR